MMIHQRPRNKITCEMDIRVQNQLNRLLSPEFDVTIAEAGDLINILNVIKAKCASCPEKFRLLVGLLCQVDLSITNIEEHYEQLLIKNRIFHLLRMFPDVAHPLLDLIARGTNQCSPLASRPITIGRLEEERYLNKTQHTKSGSTAPQPIPHNQQLNHATCLHNAAQHSGVIPPQRLLGPTPVVTQAFFGQTMTPTVYTAQPLVGIRQPPEFDASRKMYDQAPLSFRQSSLQKLGGGLISSGGTESPTDIQKRILLQQQRHLRQQLEILQAHRQQQQMVCPQNVTFALPKMVTTNTPGSQMESCLPACSTVIGPLHSLVEPMRMTTRSSQMLVSQQQTQRMCDVQRNIDIKPLDLRSPERRKATEAGVFSPAKNTSLNKHPECIPGKSSDYDSHEVPFATAARENADKEGGLLLSQVGQHCIMVSAVREDKSGSESQDSDTNGASKRSGSETEMTKTQAKSRPRKRKTSGSKGPIIKVQDLCHMTRSSQKGQVEAPSVGCNAKSALLTQELGNLNVNIALKPKQGDTSSKVALEYQGPDNYNNNNNINNNNNNISQDLLSTKSKKQRSSKRRKADKPESKSKTKQRVNSKGSGSAKESSVCKPQPMISEEPKISQNASSAQMTKKTATSSQNVTSAVFEPVTGAWSRAPASSQTYPYFQSSQSSDDTDSTYLLYGGCDDDALYQSSQYDEEDFSSNSVTEMQSFIRPDTFYGRLVDGSAHGDNAWINSTTSAIALLSDVKRKLSPTKTSQGKQEKKKY